MRRLSPWLAGLSLLFAAASAEEPSLRERIKDEHAVGADGWVYNDIAAGFAEASRTGKPLFVTFRCVPCKNCEGFDAEVAQGSELIRELAVENFVPVRQVEMKGVDLSQFQLDRDLNWAAMFLNADGTVYARYGTQSAAGADAYNSVEGLSATMRRVLKAHAAYPANKAEFAAKRGADKPYKTALEMPGLENRGKLAGATERSNCIHCHMIHDAEQTAAVAAGTFTRDMIWRFPLPENAGLVVNPQSGVRVMKVVAGSPAEAAGVRAGEDVTHMNGPAILAIADMQWALHGLKNAGDSVAVRTDKGGERTLSLPAGWKETDVSWRASLYSLPPRMPVWLEPVAEAKRKDYGLPEGATPFEVRWINAGRPGGKAARAAGLHEGDVIVGLAGRPILFADSRHLVQHLKLNYSVGDELPLTVVRKGQEETVRVKLVE